MCGLGESSPLAITDAGQEEMTVSAIFFLFTLEDRSSNIGQSEAHRYERNALIKGRLSDSCKLSERPQGSRL